MEYGLASMIRVKNSSGCGSLRISMSSHFVRQLSDS